MARRRLGAARAFAKITFGDRSAFNCPETQRRRVNLVTIRELSSLRRPTEQLIERLNCRGHAAGGWASAAADCLSRQRLRRSSRLTSRNLGEPVNNRPFTLLLGSTSCGNRPVRRANPINNLRVHRSSELKRATSSFPEEITDCCTAPDFLAAGCSPPREFAHSSHREFV